MDFLYISLGQSLAKVPTREKLKVLQGMGAWKDRKHQFVGLAYCISMGRAGVFSVMRAIFIGRVALVAGIAEDYNK